MAKRLHFVIKASRDAENQHPLKISERFRPGGRFVLNRTEWRGKEPRSCAVTNIEGGANPEGDMEWRIEVSYRPKGYISYIGNTRYDGWTAMILDRSSDPPVVVPRDIYGDVDFNELDFGDFVNEVDVQDIKHVTADAVRNEILESGSFTMSVHGSFMAPHRSRPHKKLILSSGPTGVFVDGFGTHVVNINNSTPNLQAVLMEQLANLMCEFIEGKVGLTSTENDHITMVDLSGSLVDCTPNEKGQPSRFNVLHLYTPTDFLEDLAKRLMSIYAIEVSVVDGEKGGLVLRREATTT